MKPHPLHGLFSRSSSLSFTLIELMAASAVLSLVLLLMVGMQDQMSRAWSNANRRTDVTREARAACRLMAQDFSTLATRTTNSLRTFMSGPNLTNAPVCFYYYGGSGSVAGSKLTMPNNLAPGTSYLFAVVPRAPRSLNESDFGLIGYYVARDSYTNVSGITGSNYNLHRYYKIDSSVTMQAFSNWMTVTSADSLFPSVNPANDEILARNVCNLQIRVLGSTNYTNGLFSIINYGSAVKNNLYMGNKIHFELSLYPEEMAQRLTPLTSWTNSNNILKYARSFEFRVDANENNN